MKIFNDIKSFIKNPDDFVINNPKAAIIYSTALKIASFVLLLFKTFHPIGFLLNSLILFCVSILCDYKFLSNIQRLTADGIKKKISDNPYETGYFLGEVAAIIIRPDSFQTLKGFYRGLKDKLFK